MRACDVARITWGEFASAAAQAFMRSIVSAVVWCGSSGALLRVTTEGPGNWGSCTTLENSWSVRIRILYIGGKQGGNRKGSCRETASAQTVQPPHTKRSYNVLQTMLTVFVG